MPCTWHARAHSARAIPHGHALPVRAHVAHRRARFDVVPSVPRACLPPAALAVTGTLKNFVLIGNYSRGADRPHLLRRQLRHPPTSASATPASCSFFHSIDVIPVLAGHFLSVFTTIRLNPHPRPFAAMSDLRDEHPDSETPERRRELRGLLRPVVVEVGASEAARGSTERDDPEHAPSQLPRALGGCRSVCTPRQPPD